MFAIHMKTTCFINLNQVLFVRQLSKHFREMKLSNATFTTSYHHLQLSGKLRLYLVTHVRNGNKWSSAMNEGREAMIYYSGINLISWSCLTSQYASHLSQHQVEN